MICQSCKDGAKLYLQSKEPQVSSRNALKLVRQAVKKHDDCMNGTWCDCHHRIPVEPA